MKLSKNELQSIYQNEYLTGSSVPKISKKYNISKQYFYNWFRKLNLPLRSNEINSRKYHFDENFFHDIDKPDKAYWLGFIYADGYITTKQKCGNRILGISLSIDDINHLNKLNNCLQSDVPIKTYLQKTGYAVNTTYCRLTLTSKTLTDDLMSHGVYEKKTNILKPPQIPQHLIKDFIRGYFDGDGSVWFQYKEGCKPQANIAFVGTNSLLNYFQLNLIENQIIKHTYKLNKRRPNQIVSDFKFGGNVQVLKFLKYIYEDASIFLDRKHDIYLQLKEMQNN